LANASSNKLYRTFVRGLMTEASYLTYPEDASFDELNTVPSRKGNRVRRYGINYNPLNVVPRTYDKRQVKAEFVWRSVASNASLSFLVVQNGPEISFYDRSKQEFATSKKSFTINCNDYARPGASTSGTNICRFASGKGYLFIVNKDMEPLVVTYDKLLDDIKVTKIVILARDFEGLRDGLQNDEEPSTLSKEHHYNLLNQGWVPLPGGKT